MILYVDIKIFKYSTQVYLLLGMGIEDRFLFWTGSQFFDTWVSFDGLLNDSLIDATGWYIIFYRVRVKPRAVCLCIAHACFRRGRKKKETKRNDTRRVRGVTRRVWWCTAFGLHSALLYISPWPLLKSAMIIIHARTEELENPHASFQVTTVAVGYFCFPVIYEGTTRR